MAVMKTLSVNGVTYTVTPSVPVSSVTLLASAWEDSGGAYSQVVVIPGVTAYTKVDLQPTPEQLEIFYTKALGFVAENENGVVTSRLSRADYDAAQSEKFIQEQFEGSLPAFLAAFTTHKTLSAEEIDILRRMIDNYKED